MTQTYETVMQPGLTSFHLSLAGAWARAMLGQLDNARMATHVLIPDTFESFGTAMSAVLSFHLAVAHAREVAIRTPWVDTALLDRATLDDLHRRSERFRDAYMHFGEKAERGEELPNAVLQSSSAQRSSARGLTPRGMVGLAFGFEDGTAVLYAPGGRTNHRVWARLSWVEMEHATREIESWTIELLGRWSEVQQRWGPFVETHGHDVRSTG